MASKAKDAVKSGELKIIPSRYKKIWYHWMENITDWCISRQLWWGHRIPAYYVKIINPNIKVKVILENIKLQFFYTNFIIQIHVS